MITIDTNDNNVYTTAYLVTFHTHTRENHEIKN